MKLGDKKLVMRNGEVREFKTKIARDRFEHITQAINHGWKPKNK